MAVAGDVPGKYDCVINGTGYLFYDQIDESLPFRTAKAIYSYSPTFVERQNVQGNYGDDSQAFWLTASQNDWTEGSEQRFFRSTDPDSVSKFWRSSAVDISIPGQLSLLPDIRSIDFGVGINASNAAGSPATISRMFAAVSNANLYEVATDGTVTDRGAHGAGNLTGYSVASDLSTGRVFIAGQTKLRKYDTAAHTFADFSASTMSSCVYLNNTLYGMDNSGSILYRFDTAGVATTLYTWKDATGTTFGTQTPVAGFGGKLLILRLAGEAGGELWLYDGVGTNRIAQFPANFLAWSMTVVNGIVFVAGALQVENATKYQSAVYYYANGNIGVLWKAKDASTNLSYPSIAQFQGKVVFTDETEGRFVFHEQSTGAFYSPGTFTQSSVLNASTAGGGSSFLHARATRFGYLFPHTSRPTSGYVITSGFDFDNSLDKLPRGIKVDFDSATDGNGGSVDIAYRFGDPEGSFTTLQTGAVSGTEYAVSGVSGRVLFLKITLNKGTSTLGPVLKRTYVEAVPVLKQNPLRQYVIAAFGDPAEQGQVLRDGTTNTKSGRDLANDLITAVTSQTPISITDRFSTYTGVLEPKDFELHEIHANPLVPPTKSGSFVARVTARGV